MNLILTCALFAYGMFTLQRPTFLWEGMRNVWKKFPKAVHEPLFECGICVCSIWGGIAYIFLQIIIPIVNNYLLQSLLYMPIVLIAASGVAAFIDRAVKAFEKSYGYKVPGKKEGEKKWDYLLPFEGVRTCIVNSFVAEAYKRGDCIIEVGGYHKDWENIKYLYYTAEHPLGHNTLPSPYVNSFPYSVVIMGLAFDGDLRLLRDIIANSKTTIIEYSDDGISRQQIDLLTEGLPTKVLIPEFEISPTEDAPKACGVVTKRKILIIQP